MKKLLVFVLLCAPVLALAQQAAADKPADTAAVEDPAENGIVLDAIASGNIGLHTIF